MCEICCTFARNFENNNHIHIMKHTMIWVAAFLLMVSTFAKAETEQQYVRCIAFYNLENLFDTIHDEGKNDYEYLPDGGMKWTSFKYENKIKKMGYAVAQQQIQPSSETDPVGRSGPPRCGCRLPV